MGLFNISQQEEWPVFFARSLFRLLALIGTIFIFSFSTNAYSQSTYGGITGYISEEDVYNNLDDLDLSLQYAKQEIKRGEMLNAGTALERMLYANPNWHSVRLLYAAVLYRLDDQQAALRELSLLEGKELNTDQTETFTQYKSAFAIPPRKSFEEIKNPNSVTSPVNAPANYSEPDEVSGQITVGFRADDNAGNALTDESFGFAERADVSATLEGQVKANIPLTEDNKVMARLSARGHIRRHETYSRADYDVYEARAGLSYRPAGGIMALDVNAQQVKVSGETYLNQIGPRASFSQQISDNSRAIVSLSVYDQNYKALSFASREDERDGIKTSFQLGISQKLNETQKVSAVLGYETKSADLRAFAYSGPVAALSYENELNNRWTAKSHIRARHLGFKDNLIGANVDRSDFRLSARTALAVKLGLPKNNVKLNIPELEFGVNYTLRDSNIGLNDFNNLGADVKLTVSF